MISKNMNKQKPLIKMVMKMNFMLDHHFQSVSLAYTDKSTDNFKLSLSGCYLHSSILGLY